MKSVNIDFHLPIDTRSEAGTKLILDTLEEYELRPDWQSPVELRRDTYDVSMFISEALKWRVDENFLMFGARHGTRWTGTLLFCSELAPILQLEFTEGRRPHGRRTAVSLDAAAAKGWFEVVSGLAQRFEPLFGTCVTRFGVRPYDYLHEVRAQEDGLRWRSPRTYFGGWLLDTIGADRLDGAAHAIRTLGSCVEVDVVPDPWIAPWEDVLAATERAQQALADLPIWGDYESPIPKPPPGWTGFPRVKA